MSITIIDKNNIFQKDVIGNVRTAQEDSHDIAALTPNGDVFVVCDGMGGHVGGKQASSIAVKSIIDYLKKERYPQPVQALNDALQFANMQILGYASEHPELKGMGTTACIVLLQDSEAYIAHVGDSRIYLYLGKEKQLHRITKDHSFVQTLVDTGQITDEEAEHHPSKNRILKALGVKADLTPSIDRVLPKNGDVFLICSDGLSGMISDSTITDVLTQNTNIKSKGDTLINLALEAGGLDNITLELIQIVNSPHTKTESPNYNPATNIRRSNGISKKIKQLISSLSILVICAVMGYGGYRIFRSVEHKKEIESLNTGIIDLRNTIDSLENKYNTSSNDWKESKDKENHAFERHKKDESDAGLKGAYESAKEATEKKKNIMDDILKEIEEYKRDLNAKIARRDSLTNQKKK